MATDSTIGALSNLDPSLTQTQSRKTGEQVDKQEFMTLLVTQLQNQDPLNPMDNQEFAVQLAQFSSLEQLTSINQKIGELGGSDNVSSLASYLGHEVVTNSTAAHVVGHNGGSVYFNLESDAADLKINLLDSDGQVRETVNVGPLSAGEHSLQLNNLVTEKGDFTISVEGRGVLGEELKPAGYAAGIVSGFVPGADPRLIVNGTELGTAEVKQVRYAGSV
jgi:flagellar basal-body rod modification protein FlgD